MLSIGSWRWYISITILDASHRPVFYLKQNVSDTGFCLRLEVELTQFGPLDRVKHVSGHQQQYQSLLLVSAVLVTASSGQSPWLQIQMSGFDSRSYQTFWEVVSLERRPLSPVSTIEELLERKSSGSGLDIREYGRRDLSLWPCGTHYPLKWH
jgi:hypothetical protein